MQLIAQPKFEVLISDLIMSLSQNEDLVSSSESSFYIGEFDFLKTHVSQFKKTDLVVLVQDESNLNLSIFSTFVNLSNFSVLQSENIKDINELIRQFVLKNKKKIQIDQIKNEVQKKRYELEKLNEQLNSKSQKQVFSLEQSHKLENQKNLNEKNLLHFLDFIQTESHKSDFVTYLLKFIWKELKKNEKLLQLGLTIKTFSGQMSLITFDGQAEHHYGIDFILDEDKIVQKLARVFGRPVGQVKFWSLHENIRERYFFVETMNQNQSFEQIEDYLKDRISVLGLYLDRWMIEQEYQLLMQRWDRMFQSFSGYVHIVDENFQIYKSNYAPNDQTESEKKCFKILGNRDSICEKCPIKTHRNDDFFIKENVKIKTYFSEFKFNQKKYYFVIYDDITQVHFLKSQLLHSEKMSALGRLGNHLAHEINNPLTGLKSYSQSILSDPDYDLPTTIRADLSEILKATLRSQKIIQNFIDFSHKKETVLEKVNFLEVLQNTLTLLKSALRSHRIFIDVKPVYVLAHSHDLQQVLFNLIKNACQAMESSGTIKIFQELTENKIIFHIEDTGPGFNDSIKNLLFQPFMTTKKQGDGTGLGLYLSKKMMNQMQANLIIDEQKKVGAKISLIFDKI